MEQQITELQQKIDLLTKEIAELKVHKQKYLAAKQSFNRMSTRLKKMCKRLTPTNACLLEMQKVATEIRDLTRKATAHTSTETEDTI